MAAISAVSTKRPMGMRETSSARRSAVISRAMAVSAAAGVMAFTSTPSLAISLPSVLVSATIPALDAA